MDRAHNCPPCAVDVNGCEIARTVWKHAAGLVGKKKKRGKEEKVSIEFTSNTKAAMSPNRF